MEGSRLTEDQTRSIYETQTIIMFKECLQYNIPPFIIEDVSKDYYRRGWKEYATEKGFLVETCRAAQETYKKLLEYFEYI